MLEVLVVRFEGRSDDAAAVGVLEPLEVIEHPAPTATVLVDGDEDVGCGAGVVVGQPLRQVVMARQFDCADAGFVLRKRELRRDLVVDLADEDPVAVPDPHQRRLDPAVVVALEAFGDLAEDLIKVDRFDGRHSRPQGLGHGRGHST
ncbi:hypothetical protein ACIBG0_39035 [Nocardia sp. NPDC050630]|uniref:hypothetical protein n=1 Tax=Nocardia sp. NPDC050630 TaxID=3364321 RepID=UPI0037B310D3